MSGGTAIASSYFLMTNSAGADPIKTRNYVLGVRTILVSAVSAGLLDRFARAAVLCSVLWCVSFGADQGGPLAASGALVTSEKPAVALNPVADAPRPFVKGDAVRITVSQDSLHFINGTYHIDDEGFVFLPVLGRVRVDTMPEKRLSMFLNSAYLQFLRYPTIQVQPLMRVSLLGGFVRPGLYYIPSSASLWDVVALAGGPQREDGMKKLAWERDGIVVNGSLLPIIQSGASLSTLGVRSGDLIRARQAPKRDGWEIFTTVVLPIIGVAVSAVSTSATLYYVYETYRGTR
jgi:protein involved in polysaccharide export with SLBB domain